MPVHRRAPFGMCPSCGSRGVDLVHLSDASVVCNDCWHELFELAAGSEDDVDIDLAVPASVASSARQA